MKTTPYEVVFRIKPFSEPVEKFSVPKEQDQASDTSEISESDISDSLCSSDLTVRCKRKQHLKGLVIISFCLIYVRSCTMLHAADDYGDQSDLPTEEHEMKQQTNDHTTGIVAYYYSVILLAIYLYLRS